MSNMSYCRFRNTLSDFGECVDAIEELSNGEGEALSDDERRAAIRLIDAAANLLRIVSDATGVDVEDIDYEEAESFFAHVDEQKEDVRASLVAEWAAWCTENDVPPCSADEIDRENLTPEQVAFVERFFERWEDFA